MRSHQANNRTFLIRSDRHISSLHNHLQFQYGLNNRWTLMKPIIENTLSNLRTALSRVDEGAPLDEILSEIGTARHVLVSLAEEISGDLPEWGEIRRSILKNFGKAGIEGLVREYASGGVENETTIHL